MIENLTQLKIAKWWIIDYHTVTFSLSICQASLNNDAIIFGCVH